MQDCVAGYRGLEGREGADYHNWREREVEKSIQWGGKLNERMNK